MKGLPVDPERLKEEFPELTDEELQAYKTVTRRVLGDAASRAKKMREVMAKARAAQAKGEGGSELGKEDQLLVRYLAAVAKMQRSTVRK